MSSSGLQTGQSSGNTALVVRDSKLSSFDTIDTCESEGGRHFPMNSTIPFIPPLPPQPCVRRCSQPQLIATINVGFEKGDFLIREEKGARLYFDFFEEAFNFISQKGYTRMPKDEEDDYIEVIRRAHKSVPGGTRFNAGRLLMVLRKKLVPLKAFLSEDYDNIDEDSAHSSSYGDSKDSRKGHHRKARHNKMGHSAHTLATDSESSASSNADTSCVDSWD